MLVSYSVTKIFKKIYKLFFIVILSLNLDEVIFNIKNEE